jgi:hypothetical protein
LSEAALDAYRIVRGTEGQAWVVIFDALSITADDESHCAGNAIIGIVVEDAIWYH